MKRVLKIDERDNVITALVDLPQGSVVTWHAESYILKDDVPAKHKFFSESLNKGDLVFMYGTLVGIVQSDVKAGMVVTTTNLKHAAQEYAYEPGRFCQWLSPVIEKYKNRCFKGYLRDDGRVGTANYWIFIPTVFCENRNLDVIREAFYSQLGYGPSDKYKQYTCQLVDAFSREQSIDEITFVAQVESLQRPFRNVDGIKFLNHSGGCGGTRGDAATLSQLLAAYADHPNVGGVTVLSLGCQHLQVEQLQADILKRNPDFNKPLLVFEQQRIQSEEMLLTTAIRETFRAMIELNKCERTDAPLSALTVAVKCGGSDGFSGISANPSVGYAADMIVALGGKVLLAEFPELCGVEQELIDRCVTRDNAEKFISLMRQYEAWAQAAGSGFDMNPSPGNIKDGLITDAIKSAGAAKKGGTSPIVGVLDYTEAAVKDGLNLVCTPGNDVEATTGQVAAGATLILFTTGLGTPTGNPICPTIKLATNSTLFHRMRDILDFDCGPIIDGSQTVQQVGEKILDYCIRVASGEISPKAVMLNQDDFIPWKRGVSL